MARTSFSVDQQRRLLAGMKALARRRLCVVLFGFGLGLVYSLGEGVFVFRTWPLRLGAGAAAIAIACLLARVVVAKARPTA